MRVNRAIRASSVRVIGPEGQQLGIMSARDALKKAESMGLDLVEVASNATPPVCRIIDYGKFRYQQTKKEKENKKAQHQVKVKEIKLKPNIDVHDFQTKEKRAREFLEKGFKVRVTCMFRGREMLHMDLGMNVMQKLCEDLSDIASIEMPTKKLGRMMTLVLAPGSKKK